MSLPKVYAEGSTIGPYKLKALLGRGAFGEVWLGERFGALASTNLALKLPLDGVLDLEEIRQEADLWIRSCSHPNVLPLFEADICDGQAVLVSEYVADGSLDDFLKQQLSGAISCEKAVELMIDILRGLDHLHSVGVIHRDLKPGNVMLQGGIPRLADFGLARFLKSDNTRSRLAGSPAYMAPEAFDGQRTAQSDVWSCGILLYQMISGTLPFRESSMVELMKLVCSARPAPLPEGTPESLQNVINGCLQKSTKRRYANVQQVRDDLKLFTHGEERTDVTIPGQIVFDEPEFEIEAHDTNAFTSSLGETEDFFHLITVVRAEQRRVKFPLVKDRVLIGRGDQCDIVVGKGQSTVSRYHAQLVRGVLGYAIEDTESRNGTFVNGEKIDSRTDLTDGDRIHIGPVIFEFRAGRKELPADDETLGDEDPSKYM